MGLVRFIVFAGLVWLIVVLVKRWLIQSGGNPMQPPAGKDERMVKCAYCGLHIPESEAVQADGNSYCSVEHRNAHHPRG